MNTEEDSLTSEEAADGQAVIERLITGKPLNPEVARRVRARAQKITDQLRQQHGEMNIAVDLIREIRGEE
jgi:hypothetical protein